MKLLFTLSNDKQMIFRIVSTTNKDEFIIYFMLSCFTTFNKFLLLRINNSFSIQRSITTSSHPKQNDYKEEDKNKTDKYKGPSHA